MRKTSCKAESVTVKAVRILFYNAFLNRHRALLDDFSVLSVFYDDKRNFLRCVYAVRSNVAIKFARFYECFELVSVDRNDKIIIVKN